MNPTRRRRIAPLAILTALSLASLVMTGCHARTAADADRWSYAGSEGPAHWADLSPAFAACKIGAAQSPIDIPASVEKARLVPIVFHYDPLPLRVDHNGHTFQVAGAKEATIALEPTDADRYALTQLHFHTPSEHTVAGRSFAFELHLVHKNAAGSVAVVAVFFDEGKELAALGPILDHAPDHQAEPKDVPGVKIDLASLVPPGSGYTEYVGSLTVPPCTEGVRWLVLSTPLQASAAQIHKLRSILHEATNRPTQPIGGRRVLQFSP